MEKDKAKSKELELFRDRLRAYIEITGKTQEEVSIASGFSKTYVNQFLSGRVASAPFIKIMEYKFNEIGMQELDRVVAKRKAMEELKNKQVNNQPTLFVQEDDLHQFMEKISAQLADVYAMQLTNNGKVVELIENNVAKSPGGVTIDFSEEDEKYVRIIAEKLGFSVSELVSRSVYFYWTFIRQNYQKPNFKLPKFGYFRNFDELNK